MKSCIRISQLVRCLGLSLSVLLSCLILRANGISTDMFEMDDNAISHFHTGQSWMEVGDYSAAIQEWEIAIRLKPTAAMSGVIYNNLGLAYLKIGQPGNAIKYLQKAVSTNPNYSLYYENLAKAYRQGGKCETAINQLQRLTQSNPNNVQSWYLLGSLLQAQGREAESRTAFETFVKLAPRSELADAARVNLEAMKVAKPMGNTLQ